jgi:hypothetical protein
MLLLLQLAAASPIPGCGHTDAVSVWWGHLCAELIAAAMNLVAIGGFGAAQAQQTL